MQCVERLAERESAEDYLGRTLKAQLQEPMPVFETSMQHPSVEERFSNPEEVSTAGIVLFDALARFQAGDTQSGLRCLQQLQHSRSLLTLIDALCPGLSAQSDKRSQRIRRLLGDRAEETCSGGDQGSAREKSTQTEPARTDSAELTLRQRTVLRLVLDGCSNVEIARRLSISKNTVKWHLKGIFRQLGVENRCSALKVARLRKLI